MSLTLEHIKGAVPVANIYNGSKIDKLVCYIDEPPEDEQALTKIRINDENQSFFPVINDFRTENLTQRVFVSGESGCGKTTFLTAYLINFKKKYPKSKIYFFSSKLQDKNIDDLGFVERVRIDDDVLKNPFTLAELSSGSKPCLTVFDDVEDFPNKKVTKEIDRFLHEVLRNGRSYGIYCIYTHHQPADYKATRNMIFEATHCVIFPKRSGKDAYNYFLEKKMNLNKKTIDLINNVKSNYVCIKRSIPKCVISDKYLLLV